MTCTADGRARAWACPQPTIAAFQPDAGPATYAATKAYVLSLRVASPRNCAEAASPIGLTATDMLTNAVDHKRPVCPAAEALIGDVGEVAAEATGPAWQVRICIPVPSTDAAALAARVPPKWLLRRVAGALGRPRCEPIAADSRIRGDADALARCAA